MRLTGGFFPGTNSSTQLCQQASWKRIYIFEVNFGAISLWNAKVKKKLTA